MRTQRGNGGVPATGLEIALGNQIISAVVGATHLYVRRSRLREGAGIVTVRQLTADIGEQVSDELRPFVAALSASQQSRVTAYLGSAEYKAFVRHLCALRLLHGPEYREISQRGIAVLSAGVRLYLASDRATKSLAQQLGDISIRAVDQAFAHGAKGLKKHLKDPVFHDFLVRQEGLIDQTIEALIHTGQPADAIVWLERYTRAAKARYGRLRAPHWDAQAIVPLERVYVPAKFRFLKTPADSDLRRVELLRAREERLRLQMRGLSPSARAYRHREFEQYEQSRDKSELTYEELVIDRTVVLGDPGAGKTTLGSRIAMDVLAGREFINGAESSPSVPFIVTLRELADPSRSASFVEYIERLANDSFQAKPPPGLIDFLLLTGRALVIFDGLDELLDTSLRRKVVHAIEAFTASFMNTPVLVTARQVGYELAPLDAEAFTALHIQSFDQADVERYVHSWFLLDESIPSARDRRAAGDRFLTSSDTVRDLRSNPLLLALLCNLFKATGYQDLPRSRPAVLEKCSLVLFDRWDRHRSIGNIDFERDFEPIVAFIAYTMFTDRRFVDGISAPQLIDLTVKYLWPGRFSTEDGARSFARSFVDHCSGRAWVFSDVGTTSEGEPIYQFTHRTFMEYFTALSIVRSLRVPERIFEILGPHILASDWGLVPLLTVQILGRRFDEAADDVVLELVALASSHPEAANQAGIFLKEMQDNIPLGATARQLIEEYAGAIHAPGIELSSAQLPSETTTHSKNPDLDWHEIEGSTLVKATAYDAEAQEVHVRFYSGEYHIYSDCKPYLWQVFMRPTTGKGEFVTNVLQHRERPMRSG
jgi:hypothetical protein